MERKRGIRADRNLHGVVVVSLNGLARLPDDRIAYTVNTVMRAYTVLRQRKDVYSDLA